VISRGTPFWQPLVKTSCNAHARGDHFPVLDGKLLVKADRLAHADSGSGIPLRPLSATGKEFCELFLAGLLKLELEFAANF
jgi:hypothetical protein